MKTINCEECNVLYQYEPVKGYPDKRKYCANCSESKQKQWESKTAPVPEAQTTDANAETVPMNLPDQTVTSKTEAWVEKPKKSYELTDGNIRIGALTCAIEVSKNIGQDLNLIKSLEDYAFLLEIASKFEEYIRNGKE